MPDVVLERSGVQRMCILHKNVPAMLANITTLLARDRVNVENPTNKSKGDYAYTIVDLGEKVEDSVINDVSNLANIIRVRVID
jgi:D-3-phosphoglycerate dehydrogenase